MITDYNAKAGARVRLIDDNADAQCTGYTDLKSVKLYNGALGTIIQDGIDIDGDVYVAWDGFEHPDVPTYNDFMYLPMLWN